MSRIATWEAEYRHDRRKHRHRCFCCRKIINAGEPVLMGLVGGKASRALHIECAEVPVTREGDVGHPFTHRDLLRAHARRTA